MSFPSWVTTDVCSLGVSHLVLDLWPPPLCLTLSPQDTARGEAPAASLFPTPCPIWLKSWETSLWLRNSSSCTGRPTTWTCGWGPSPSPPCPEAESGRSWPACCPDSSEPWERETGNIRSSSSTDLTTGVKRHKLKQSVFVLWGSGGRRRECSPAPRGDTSTPSLCPASFVITATSPSSLRTRSHALRAPRTCWPVPTRSSPTSISAPGKNQTQVTTQTYIVGDIFHVCYFFHWRLSQIPAVVRYPGFNLVTPSSVTLWFCMSVTLASSFWDLHLSAVIPTRASGAPPLQHVKVQRLNRGWWHTYRR